MHDDIEEVLFSTEQILSGIIRVADELTRDYGGDDFVVVGVLKGSVVFVADLVRNIPAKLEMAFVGASSYGAGTTSGELKLNFFPMDEEIRGRRILLVDDILDSQEYLNAFGYDTVPYHRNRVVGSRDLGETPFNITTPRYEAYYSGILGFPQLVYTGTAKTIPARSGQRRGGFPEDYLPWVRNLPAMRSQGGASGSVSMDYLAKVPYRSVGR